MTFPQRADSISKKAGKAGGQGPVSAEDEKMEQNKSQ